MCLLERAISCVIDFRLTIIRLALYFIRVQIPFQGSLTGQMLYTWDGSVMRS